MRAAEDHTDERGTLPTRLFAAGLRWTMRPAMEIMPFNAIGVRSARTFAEIVAPLAGPVVPGTRVDILTAHGVRGEIVRAPGVTRSDAAILYVHGSGYVICSARTHRGLVSRLSQATGLPVLSLDYRLAPDHVFPAPADDVRAGYEHLLAGGFPPDRIVIAGDSAGGHLAVDLAMQNGALDLPQVAALVLFSPLMDLSLRLGEAADAERRDPMLSPRAARRLVRLYAAGDQLGDPRLGLQPHATSMLPPILIHAGGAEMFRRDAEVLSEQVQACGGQCELKVWPDQMHVFQAVTHSKASKRSIAEAAAFINRVLDRS